MLAALRASSMPQLHEVRLLQIVESLDTGAVENWLLRVFAAAGTTNPEYHWTFFCTLGKAGRLDERVRRLGGEIIYSPYEIGDKRAFICNLRAVIKEGRFDILHCHHDFVSAVYLVASLGLPLRKRIVHVHNTDEGILTPSPLKQFLLKEPMRQTCMRLADNVVGNSRETLSQFTRSAQPKPGRDRVVYYGINTSPFHEHIRAPEEFRSSLGLPPDAKLLLFAGRMVPLKNPVFVVEILAELAPSDPKIMAVFVGAGELEAGVQALAEQKGLNNRIRILGWRDDTATIMRLSDLLIFPRLEEPKEGLGLVLVEAQAAGLPVLASPSVTEDVQVIPELFEFLPLATGPRRWAEAALSLLSKNHLSRQQALGLVEASPFGLDAGVANLLSLYSDVN
jgi:glycosyltransferase involved in cell wall biosynthesis